MKRLIIFCITVQFIISCNKNEDPAYNQNVTSAFTLEFDNISGENDLELNTNYHNSANEEFAVTKLKYIVSNLVLTNNDGSTYVVPNDSTYTVDESDSESGEINLEIPEGEYRKVEFTVSYLLIEGTSDVGAGTYSYEIGTANGNASTRSITIDLSAAGTAKVKAGRHSEVHLMTDVQKFFSGFTITTEQEIVNGDFDALPGSNITTMIKHDHTHNN